MENTENMIEFLTNARTATCTFTNKKHINRIKNIYKERKDEFGYLNENEDGSICCKIPLKWVKINPGTMPGTGKKREMSDEQKAKLREGLIKARAARANSK